MPMLILKNLKTNCWAIGTVVALLALNGLARAESVGDASKRQTEYMSPGIAACTSFVLPGSAQLYNGQRLAGWSQLGIWAGSLAGGFAFSSMAGSTYDQYKAASSVKDAKDLYDQTALFDKLSIGSFVLAGSMHVVSSIHAYISSKTLRTASATALRLDSLTMYPRDGGVQFAASFSFGAGH